jgi:hypothetical protein
MQVPHYALALVQAKVPTSTQLPGRENSRTAETNKIFPRAPTHLRRLALWPACRAHSVDAAFADPSKTNLILAVGAVVSQVDNIRKSSARVARRCGDCIGRAKRDRWELRGREGSHGGPLQARENHHCRASGQTHLFGASPMVVLCQGTNAMRVRNNTSSVRSYIGQPRALVRENIQSRALASADTSNLKSSFIQPNTTTRDCPHTLTGRRQQRANMSECITETLLSSAHHQGRATTTGMGRRSTRSTNTTYMTAYKRTKLRGKIAAIHIHAHGVT